MAFRNKAESILKLEPDLLIVPECEHPERLKFKNSMFKPKGRLWVGDNATKGLGVFSYSELEISLHPAYDNRFRYVLPIKVTGSTNFNLFAVWAMNDKNEPQNRYIGQVWLAINYYVSLFKEKTIIVGDFNSNKIWDNDRPTKVGNHSDVIEFLGLHNIYSSYHVFFDEDPGGETQKTFFLHRKEHKSYHIDYCFASKELLDRIIDVEVGKFDDWIAISDHTPLIVSFKS